MKAAALLVAVTSAVIIVSPKFAVAGVAPVGEVPEPTAMLVWLGLAGAGALFYSRRNRES